MGQETPTCVIGTNQRSAVHLSVDMNKLMKITETNEETHSNDLVTDDFSSRKIVRKREKTSEGGIMLREKLCD